jgi:hypothetical protein
MDVCPRFFCVGSGLVAGLIGGIKELCQMSIINKLHSSRIILTGNKARGPNTKDGRRN